MLNFLSFMFVLSVSACSMSRRYLCRGGWVSASVVVLVVGGSSCKSFVSFVLCCVFFVGGFVCVSLLGFCFLFRDFFFFFFICLLLFFVFFFDLVFFFKQKTAYEIVM